MDARLAFEVLDDVSSRIRGVGNERVAHRRWVGLHAAKRADDGGERAEHTQQRSTLASRIGIE